VYKLSKAATGFDTAHNGWTEVVDTCEPDKKVSISSGKIKGDVLTKIMLLDHCLLQI